MEENKLFEEQVIKVGDDTQYYVLKQTIYNGQIYLFANELKDEETPSDTMAILKVDNSTSQINIVIERDKKVLVDLIRIFDKLLV